MADYDVTIKKVDVQTIASIRDIVPTYKDVGVLLEELLPILKEKGVGFAGPAMVIYHDTEYKEKDIDAEAAVPVVDFGPSGGRVKFRELPGVEMAASVVHQGSYETLDAAYQALMDWTSEKGYRISGPIREIYVHWEKEDPSALVTEIQVPVAKA